MVVIKSSRFSTLAEVWCITQSYKSVLLPLPENIRPNYWVKSTPQALTNSTSLRSAKQSGHEKRRKTSSIDTYYYPGYIYVGNYKDVVWGKMYDGH